MLWHRQQDLILIFSETGMSSLRPSQAKALTIQDARFDTQRTFISARGFNLPQVRGLAEVVGETPRLSVISVNPGLYLSPSALAEVRTALEGTALAQAYTAEDGRTYKRSLFRIFRSFCKSHSHASANSSETLYLVDNMGQHEARKLTLGYAIKQTIEDRNKRPLLRAVLAREGSKTRIEGISQFLAAMQTNVEATAYVAAEW